MSEQSANTVKVKDEIDKIIVESYDEYFDALNNIAWDEYSEHEKELKFHELFEEHINKTTSYINDNFTLSTSEDILNKRACYQYAMEHEYNSKFKSLKEYHALRLRRG